MSAAVVLGGNCDFSCAETLGEIRVECYIVLATQCSGFTSPFDQFGPIGWEKFEQKVVLFGDR